MNNRSIVLICSAAAAMMLGGAFASKPLYDTFCRITGFGGTTQRDAQASSGAIERMMTVRFDANVEPGLGLAFEPMQLSQEVRVGDNALAFYRMENISDRPLSLMATYNVSPHKAGPFFVKMECFCFREQTLQPGESMEAPVVFYIDPEIADEPRVDDVRTITLSYTFFEREGAQDLAQGRANAAPGEG